MVTRTELQRALRDAATSFTAVKAVAKKLQRAKVELKALDNVPAERPKRRGG